MDFTANESSAMLLPVVAGAPPAKSIFDGSMLWSTEDSATLYNICLAGDHNTAWLSSSLYDKSAMRQNYAGNQAPIQTPSLSRKSTTDTMAESDSSQESLSSYESLSFQKIGSDLSFSSALNSVEISLDQMSEIWLTQRRKQRRKEQNRAAQQKHRLRKEAHIQTLETQLKDLQSNQDNLFRLCKDQRGEIERLNKRIAGLVSHLNTLCLD